jgi:hypothetical protein
MISKELLSEVLGCKLDIDEQLQPNDIEYIEKVGSKLYYRYINIYELQNLCKEWALLNDYSCMSRPRLFGGWLSELMSDYGVEDTQFDADSEPEVVFKACQWILKYKDK